MKCHVVVEDFTAGVGDILFADDTSVILATSSIIQFINQLLIICELVAQ